MEPDSHRLQFRSVDWYSRRHFQQIVKPICLNWPTLFDGRDDLLEVVRSRYINVELDGDVDTLSRVLSREFLFSFLYSLREETVEIVILLFKSKVYPIQHCTDAFVKLGFLDTSRFGRVCEDSLSVLVLE
ncbi:hypothetical protein C469_00745 [Halorubrum lipolyticum DSM 21995]|uniref:Uncharacterized protein n=1 Tax=Halorubrum lipolyticum DSM 21995 TaxID=1227482 RepID=M0P5C1_9EURY|nr:hypothetical protein C469_00745 [Halorubrum lipolyticum DSM 21995]